MESIGDILRSKDPSKKQINAMIRKAAPDLKKERDKYLENLAISKAALLNDKKTVLK